MSEVRSSICRLCTAHCPILVTMEDGVVAEVHGDRDVPVFEGYTCPKGRALPAVHANPGRLLQSLRRRGDGTHEPISSELAVAEIADRLHEVVERHGPEAVAIYIGTSVIPHPTVSRLASALLMALGSPNVYSAGTIDQPGMIVAEGFHGVWRGGRPSFDDADAWLFVGTNPIISKQYLEENPARRLARALDRGVQVVVVDPRRTETARRATLHLQPRPGEDAVVVAGLLRLIVKESWVDHEFVREHVDGFDVLERALRPFTPDIVAQQADISAGDLIEAARVLGTARRGIAAPGTGAAMSNPGPLVPYLLLCLASVRGWWSREGEPMSRPNVLLPPNPAKAQAYPPYPVRTGRRMRVRNLEQTIAGLPTGALAEEILLPGPGQIRALFNVGGSPATAWPDQQLARRALEDLELFVTTDVEYSPTARLADYVVATKLALETPGMTQGTEIIKYLHFGYGFVLPYAQYSPAIVDPPAGADVIEDWQLYYRIAQRLRLDLQIVNFFGAAGGYLEAPIETLPLDMVSEPTTDDLYDLMCRGSRIPLDEVRGHPGGTVFEELKDLRVARADHEAGARLDIGNEEVLGQLAGFRRKGSRPNPSRPFLLIPRRENRVINTFGRTVPGLMGNRPYNPAFLHPQDMADLGLGSGDLVQIESDFAAVVGVAETDRDLKRGVVSMSHAFGANPGEPEDPKTDGANTNRLFSTEVDCDPISGQPRMGAVAVALCPVPGAA